MITTQEFIERYHPCDSALDWLRAQPSLAAAWDTCPRADWLLWALKEIGYADGRVLRLLACDFVRYTPLADGRTTWNLLTDERSRSAVEVSERYANGLATDVELADAHAAAALAAGVATWDAAGDAAKAAAGAVTWDAVGAAAWAAAWATARDTANAADGAAAARYWAAANTAQADMVRARISRADIAPDF